MCQRRLSPPVLLRLFLQETCQRRVSPVLPRGPSLFRVSSPEPLEVVLSGFSRGLSCAFQQGRLFRPPGFSLRVFSGLGRTLSGCQRRLHLSTPRTYLSRLLCMVSKPYTPYALAVLPSLADPARTGRVSSPTVSGLTGCPWHGACCRVGLVCSSTSLAPLTHQRHGAASGTAHATC